MEHLRRLIFGDPVTKVHPVQPDDVKPAPLPPHLQERAVEQEKLSLRLLSEVTQMSATSAQIRKALGREVAIKLQRRA